jgi:cupin superfamily acireductone dioxygenase involved in methionine salvage
VATLTAANKVMKQQALDSAARESQMQAGLQEEREASSASNAEMKSLRHQLATASSRVSDLTLNLSYAQKDLLRLTQGKPLCTQLLFTSSFHTAHV